MKKSCLIGILLIIQFNLFAAGHMEVNTVPDGAKIYIEFLSVDSSIDEASLRAQDPRFQDGPGFAGVSPVLVEMIGVGKFKVYAEKQGYLTKTTEVSVFDEETTTINMKLNKGQYTPVIRDTTQLSNRKDNYSVELSLKKQNIPVPISDNLSEIIIKDSTGKKTILDTIDIKNRDVPDTFKGNFFDTIYYVNDLSDEWSIIAQMGEKDNYNLEIKVYDSNRKLIYQDSEKGSYDIVSIYSWELKN